MKAQYPFSSLMLLALATPQSNLLRSRFGENGNLLRYPMSHHSRAPHEGNLEPGPLPNQRLPRPGCLRRIVVPPTPHIPQDPQQLVQRLAAVQPRPVRDLHQPAIHGVRNEPRRDGVARADDVVAAAGRSVRMGWDAASADAQGADRGGARGVDQPQVRRRGKQSRAALGSHLPQERKERSEEKQCRQSPAFETTSRSGFVSRTISDTAQRARYRDRSLDRTVPRWSPSPPPAALGGPYRETSCAAKYRAVLARSSQSALHPVDATARQLAGSTTWTRNGPA